ncbi:MAG TPA: XdhC/CoxI family protein [Bacteroidales bacterium]|nr:XdhC/CoxI family protein [Bacteroidales bacterium]HOS72572.1 XdhC/CoxI family protein [Bacteroidales bacterium]HQH24542.1 XdhC/CoxI family protein [Bacteroidales bacterium]HQJ83426.1 XdhC/CoxI family protein [Bacteroidales bacterium]
MIDNIYFRLLRLAPVISNPVLVTITETEGSTPQKAGNSAIFSNRGLIAGTVGGGLAERRVQELAIEYAGTGKSSFYHSSFDNTSDDPDEAICGGKVTMLIDADPLRHLDVYRDMEKTIMEEKPGVLATWVSQHEDLSVGIQRFWIKDRPGDGLPPQVADILRPLVSEILASQDSNGYVKTELEIPGEKSKHILFLEPVFPLPKLVIAGAGHIGKALSHLGRLTGFEVTVIDNRKEFANSDNLPEAGRIIVKDIGQAMAEIDKTPDTYIVIVTRGHGCDADALRPCIGSEAGYVGMIGSRAKVAKMRSDFISEGWATEDQWKRIHSPIGLEIKSETVQEIAVSIMAQLILVKNSRKSRQDLSDH